MVCAELLASWYRADNMQASRSGLHLNTVQCNHFGQSTGTEWPVQLSYLRCHAYALGLENSQIGTTSNCKPNGLETWLT